MHTCTPELLLAHLRSRRKRPYSAVECEALELKSSEMIFMILLHMYYAIRIIYTRDGKN